MPQRKNIIHSIQFIRLFLAIFVVFSHIGLFVINPFQTHSPHILQGSKIAYPEIAVTTFIAISGFVMYFSVKNTSSAKNFMINRLIRIFPIYFIIILSCLSFTFFYYYFCTSTTP